MARFPNFTGQPSGGGGGGGGGYTDAEIDAKLLLKANLSGGKHATGEIHDYAITSVYVVNTTAARDAMLASGANPQVREGDVVKVTSDNITYIYQGSNSWQVIDSTVISWDNCQSAAGKSATTKYAELDTAFTQKLDIGVTGMHSSSGQSLFGVTNQTLSLRRLIAGTNVTLSESSGLITINSSGGSGGISNALTGCSRSSNDLVFSQAVGSNITVGLPVQQSFDVTGLAVSGTTL